MDRKQRQDAFLDELIASRLVDPSWKVAQAWSITNGAAFLDDGIQFGVFSFESWIPTAHTGVAVASCLHLPKGATVYQALLISQGLDRLSRRLDEMRTRAQTDSRFSARNNNVRFNVRHHGGLHLTNAAYLSVIGAEHELLGDPIPVDGIAYAVYPRQPEGSQASAVFSLVEDLAAIAGPGRLRPLFPFRASSQTQLPLPALA